MLKGKKKSYPRAEELIAFDMVPEKPLSKKKNNKNFIKISTKIFIKTGTKRIKIFNLTT